MVTFTYIQKQVFQNITLYFGKHNILQMQVSNLSLLFAVTKSVVVRIRFEGLQREMGNEI